MSEKSQRWIVALLVLLAANFVVDSRVLADEKLKGIACRSVHLQYGGPKGTAFYNEVAVEKSAPGTYFCVCGFNHGYYGIQELANGKKLLIFSVWDPGKQNDPNSVETEQRVKLLYQDEKVRVGRFGGEGTGGQSFYDFDWQPGETYRFLVTAKPVQQRTEFTGWFYFQSENKWQKLVTFSTLTGGKMLGGYYSFVEDFRRNRESTEHVRQAKFGNGWVQAEDGQWQPLAQARFTADSNPVTNINAGLSGEAFFLATGGDTKNDSIPLGKPIERKLPPDAKAPADLPAQ